MQETADQVLSGTMFGLHRFLFGFLSCLRGIKLVAGIIHGEIAPENSLQYVVSVRNNRGHVCGGFLITEDFVLTAAHCDNLPFTHVVLHDHNLKIDNHTKIKIEKIFKHPSFRKIESGNDIMLLQLSREVQLSHKVKLAPLLSAEVNLKENEECLVAGWGINENRLPADELRVTNVSVIEPQVCKKKWGVLPAHVICAGRYGTEKEFCRGDGGGPLVCRGLVVGLVSFNTGGSCNSPDALNVYTDISKYLQWIINIVLPTKNPPSLAFCGRKLKL